MDQSYATPHLAVSVRLHHLITSPPQSQHWLPFPSLISQLRRHLCPHQGNGIASLTSNNLTQQESGSSTTSSVHQIQYGIFADLFERVDETKAQSHQNDDAYLPNTNPFHINSTIDTQHAILDQINYIEPATGNTYLMSACASLALGMDQFPVSSSPQSSSSPISEDKSLLERVSLVHWLLDIGADPNLINTFTKKTILHVIFETTPNLSPPIMSIITRLIFEYSAAIASIDGSHRLPIGSLLTNPFLSVTPSFVLLIHAMLDYNRSSYPPESDPLVQPLTHILLANKKHFDINWPSAQDFSNPTLGEVPFPIPELSSNQPDPTIFNRAYRECISIEGKWHHDQYEWQLYKYLLFSLFPSQRQSLTSLCHIESVRSPTLYSVSLSSLWGDYKAENIYHIPTLPFYQLFTILPKFDISLSYDQIYTSLSPTEYRDQLHSALTVSSSQTKEIVTTSQSPTIQLPQIPTDNIITNPTLPPISMLQCFYLAKPDLFQDIHQPIILMLLSHPYITPKHVDIIKFLLLLRQDIDLMAAPLFEILAHLLTHTYTIPPDSLLKQLPQIFSPLSVHSVKNGKNNPLSTKFPWEMNNFSPQVISHIGPIRNHGSTLPDIDATPTDSYPLDHYGVIPPFETDWTDKDLFTPRTAPYIDLFNFIFALIENCHYASGCLLRNNHESKTRLSDFQQRADDEYLELIKTNDYIPKNPMSRWQDDPLYKSEDDELKAKLRLEMETKEAIEMNKKNSPFKIPEQNTPQQLSHAASSNATSLNPNRYVDIFKKHSFQQLCGGLISITITSTMLHIKQLEHIHKFILYYSPLTNPYCNMPYLLNTFLQNAQNATGLDGDCIIKPYPKVKTIENNHSSIELKKIKLLKKLAGGTKLLQSDGRMARDRILAKMSDLNISIAQVEQIDGQELWQLLKKSAMFESNPNSYWLDLCTNNEATWQSKLMSNRVINKLHAGICEDGPDDDSDSSSDDSSTSDENSSKPSTFSSKPHSPNLAAFDLFDGMSDDDDSDYDDCRKIISSGSSSSSSASDYSDYHDFYQVSFSGSSSSSSASDSSTTLDSDNSSDSYSDSSSDSDSDSSSDSSDSDEEYFEPLSLELVTEFTLSRSITDLIRNLTEFIDQTLLWFDTLDELTAYKPTGNYAPETITHDRQGLHLFYQHQVYHFPQQYHHRYFEQLLLLPQSRVVQYDQKQQPVRHLPSRNQINWESVLPLATGTLLTSVFKPLDGSLSSWFFKNGDIIPYFEQYKLVLPSLSLSMTNTEIPAQLQSPPFTMALPPSRRTIYPESVRPRHQYPSLTRFYLWSKDLEISLYLLDMTTKTGTPGLTSLHVRK